MTVRELAACLSVLPDDVCDHPAVYEVDGRCIEIVGGILGINNGNLVLQLTGPVEHDQRYVRRKGVLLFNQTG